MIEPPVVVLRMLPEEIFDMANVVEVACWSDVLPATVSVLLALSAPFALSAPPTLRSEERVVEPVTTNVPVEVAPVVVKPPLNATRDDVAPAGNG